MNAPPLAPVGRGFSNGGTQPSPRAPPPGSAPSVYPCRKAPSNLVAGVAYRSPLPAALSGPPRSSPLRGRPRPCPLRPPAGSPAGRRKRRLLQGPDLLQWPVAGRGRPLQSRPRGGEPRRTPQTRGGRLAGGPASRAAPCGRHLGGGGQETPPRVGHGGHACGHGVSRLLPC